MGAKAPRVNSVPFSSLFTKLKNYKIFFLFLINTLYHSFIFTAINEKQKIEVIKKNTGAKVTDITSKRLRNTIVHS